MTREEIKETYSMREIAGRYGLIPNRAGFVPCPFHSGDRQASMKIYEKDYNCFGCGENGDIFTFVQRMEDVPFPKAFQLLGGTYEWESPKTARIRAAMRRQERARKAREEAKFIHWKRTRLHEICRLLRLLDALWPELVPFTDGWEATAELKQKNEYRYWVLTEGTRQEQEKMRKLDE